VIAFTALLSVLTGIVFGLAPALETVRPDVLAALKDESSGARRARLRNGLVVTQIALSALLLVGAGLFLRGLRRAQGMDPGFDPSHAIAMSFDLELAGYDERAGRAFYDELEQRVAALPGVTAVAYAEHLPLGLGRQNTSLEVEGRPLEGGQPLEIDYVTVSADYFAAMRIPMARGREFSAADRAGAPRVVIVNQTFARRFWPGTDPIGKRITREMNGEGWMEVVGVATDSKYYSLNEDPRAFVFLPSAQNYADEMTLVARTRGVPGPMIPKVASVVKTLDPKLPMYEAEPLEEHLDVSMVPARLVSSLLGALGALALVLATVGLSGVVAFAATQRTREIGIRMALGALPADVLRLVLGQGMRLATLGLAIGLAAAASTMHLVRGFLYGVSPTDPLTIVGIAALLGGVTLIATWLPAHRASRVDPVIALRHE
jgi:predicted permease